MRYWGSKSVIADDVAKALLSHTTIRETYYEPFVGGGHILRRMSKHFKRTFASDIHEDLILMWRALQNDWQPPTEITYNDYFISKYSPPSALRGFIGHSASFGGLWFAAYAKFVQNGELQNFAKQSAQSLNNTMAELYNVKFSQLSYEKVEYSNPCVIYCDPPYAGTTDGVDRSSLGVNTSFNTAAFWEFYTQLSLKGFRVYVSEFSAPKDWVSIWSKTRPVKMRMSTNKRVTENLFVHERNSHRE